LPSVTAGHSHAAGPLLTPQVSPALLAAQSVVSVQALQFEVAFMVQVRMVSPEQMV
jgi:hypothetical protein